MGLHMFVHIYGLTSACVYANIRIILSLLGKGVHEVGITKRSDDVPFSAITDGNWGRYFTTNLLSPSFDLTGKGFIINLASTYRIVGFTILPCGAFTNVAVSASASTSNPGRTCVDVNNALAVDDWSCLGCDEGDGVLGEGLPTQVFYVDGRYVHFLFTTPNATPQVCVKEIYIKAFPVP